MKGLFEQGGLKLLITRSQLLLTTWLLLNGGILFYLQSNLKYHHTLNELALSTSLEGKKIGILLLSGETSAKVAANAALIGYQKNLLAFQEGGIAQGSDFIVAELPEAIRLRSKSLLQTSRSFSEQPTPLLAKELETENTQLLAGFSQLSQQAEDQCLIGLSLLGLMNLLVLIFVPRLINTLLISRIFRLKKEVTSLEAEAPQAIAKPDEIDTIAQNLYQVKKEIALATTFVQQTGEGNFPEHQQEVNHPLTHPLFNALTGMQKQMRKVAEEDKQRNWTSQGLAKFVDILRSKDDDLEALANTIIAELVNYAHANQGALYLVTKNEKQQICLKLEACFAYNRRKWLDQEFLPGDGLVGQVYLERQTIYLTEIPDNYINITSGLGDAAPKGILIVPLIINEEVMGVLELASFQAFAPFEIQFVEKLGENIASTLAGVRNSQETRKLLEESQMMAENLRAQEEEMRQNMEELTATQEEMLRKELELNGHMNAINNTLATIEFNLEGKIITANQNFLTTVGYRLEEIQQNHHRMFCESEYIQSEAYAEFWRSLAQGKAQNGEFLRINKAGEPIWLRASYTPVLDGQGRPVKVIKCAFDISEEKHKAIALKDLLESNDQQMGQMKAQEESLQQSMEQMQAQEEELRQNMEEMQAIQEELHRKMLENESMKKELNARVAALDEAAILSESDLYGNIIYANPKFCEVSQYTAEELLDKPHSLLRHPDTPKEVFKQLWATIKAGKVFKGRYPNRAKDGSTYWVDATIVPVFDAEGRPEKYIGIRFLIENKAEQVIKVHQAVAKK